MSMRTISSPAAKVTIAYTVEQGGVMTVKAVYHGVKGLPQLPVFGVRMILPTLAEGFTTKTVGGDFSGPPGWRCAAGSV
ncbi:MAG: hypothetical protein ACLSG9_11710 [Eubacterium sp.]